MKDLELMIASLKRVQRILSYLYEKTINKDRSKVLHQDADMLTLKYLSVLTATISISDSFNFDKIYHSNHFMISSLVRSKYEHVAAYYHIFIYPQNEDEQWTKFLVWYLAGEYSRIKGVDKVNFDEEMEKLSEIHSENAQKATEALKQTKTFQLLDDTNKEKLLKGIELRKWEVDFKANKCINTSIDPIFKKIGIKTTNLINLYRNLSLASHPNYISIIQMRVLSEDNDQRLSFIIQNLACTIFFTCLYISGYCKFYKSAELVFNTLSSSDKDFVNKELAELAGAKFIV